MQETARGFAYLMKSDHVSTYTVRSSGDSEWCCDTHAQDFRDNPLTLPDGDSIRITSNGEAYSVVSLASQSASMCICREWFHGDHEGIAYLAWMKKHEHCSDGTQWAKGWTTDTQPGEPD